MKLQYPDCKIKTRATDKEEIWDPIRKKWVWLTPEEWVRQHFCCYLVEVARFPAALIAIEKQVKVNGRLKRMDIILHDRTGKPMAIVECKREEQALSDKVFRQAAVYNMAMRVPYLIITNGKEVISAGIDFGQQDFHLIDGLPELPEKANN